MSGGSTFHGTRHHMLRHMTLVCSVRNRYPSRTLYRMELQSIASTDKSTRIQGRSMALHRRRLLQARDTDQCLVPDTSSQVLVTLVYGRWLLPCLGIQMDRPPVAAHRLSGYLVVGQIFPREDDFEGLLEVPKLSLTTHIKNSVLCVPLAASWQIGCVSSSRVVSHWVISIHLNFRRAPRHNCFPAVLAYIKPSWNFLFKDDVWMLEIANVIAKRVLDPVVREKVNVKYLDGELFWI